MRGDDSVLVHGGPAGPAVISSGGGDLAKDLDHVRRLAERDSLAVVATTRPDGSVHASVVNAGVLTDPVTSLPCVGLVTRGDSRKLAYMRLSRRATVTFRHGWDWVAVEGPVSLIGPLEDSHELGEVGIAVLLRDIFVAAGGTHPDWEEYDRVMREEKRTAVLVLPERFSGNS